MTDDNFQRYIELCRQMYERMRREGFPWEKEDVDEEAN
jgi:hypothetical protein